MYTDCRGLFLSPGALFHFAGNKKSTILSRSGLLIRIRIDFGNLDPDPDPGGQN
jgi:hypothetical protein